jgi:hypothetical protein
MNGKGFESTKVKCIGIVGLLEDRFTDMSADERPPEQKLYLDGKSQLIYPSENIFSFLYSQDAGCAKRFEGKRWMEYSKQGMAYTSIIPEFPTIGRNGKAIKFIGFKNEYDEEAHIRVLHHKAIVKKGKLSIPSPKTRPLIETPWEVEFEVTIANNSLISIEKIQNWFMRGGIEIGFGTYRPRFGRFMVEFRD